MTSSRSASVPNLTKAKAKAVLLTACQRSKSSSVFISLLATTATLMAGKAFARPIAWGERLLCPALNLLLIANPGSGKSRAIEYFCTDTLSSIANQTKRQYVDAPNTFKAFRKFMNRTNGFGSIIVDEIFNILISLANDVGGALAILNKAWCGQPLNVSYGSVEGLSVPQSCVTMFGTIHPASYHALINNIWVQGNGYEDRWLCTVVDDIVADLSQAGEQLKTPAPNVRFQDFFTALADYYNRSERQVYTLSPEAYQFLCEISKEEMAVRAKENVELVSSGSSGKFKTQPSKLEDNVVKLSLVLHSLTYGLLSFLDTGVIDIPPQIELQTLEKAVKYVTVSAHIANFFSSDTMCEGEDAMKELLVLPGPYHTLRFAKEAYRSTKHLLCGLTDQQYDALVKQLTNLQLGKQEKVVFRNREILAFYKCPPQTVDKDQLMNLGVMPVEYKRIFFENLKISQSRLQTGGDSLASLLECLKDNNPYKLLLEQMQGNPDEVQPIDGMFSSRRNAVETTERQEGDAVVSSIQLSKRFCPLLEPERKIDVVNINSAYDSIDIIEAMIYGEL